MIHRFAPLCAALLALLGLFQPAAAIPYFARRYGVTCARCHASPPKLNAFGEAFVAAGYSAPGLEARPTWPLAVWVSGRTESLPASGPFSGDVLTYLNRVEVISGGRLVVPWLSYFVEWRAVSLEARSDGSKRDRSGRFEDLFMTGRTGQLEVALGQFRMLQQADVSRRIGLSEPLALSAALPGSGDGDLTPRQRSLRGFAPAGRSPSARAAWHHPLGGGIWTTSFALPLPGEISIPLTREARTEASNEIEARLKGVFVESYFRRGLLSAGAHAFYDDGERYLLSALGTGSRGAFHGAAVVGFDHVAEVTRGRWSLEGEYIPRGDFAVGARVEDRAADGAGVAFLPYLNVHYPGTRFTVRLTLEQRLQRDRQATLLELGTVF